MYFWAQTHYKFLEKFSSQVGFFLLELLIKTWNNEHKATVQEERT